MLARGRILAASTIAASSPARTASCRKTEFSILRAAGAKPKEILLSPKTVRQPGSSFLMARIASKVWIAASFKLASPEPTVKVKQSKSRSCGRRPYSPTAIAWMALAMRNLSAFCMAMPSSSIVRATRAAPYFFAARQTRCRLLPPSSRLIELMMARPG